MSLGASGGCNYKTSSRREAVATWSGGRGVDIILDCIGGSYAADNLASLAVDGTWVLYGLMGGAEVSGPILGGEKWKRESLNFYKSLSRFAKKERKFKSNHSAV